MYNFELINSSAYYGGQFGSDEIIPHQYFVSNSPETSSPILTDENATHMIYSDEVHRRLFGAVAIMVFSGVLSLIAVVFESVSFGMIGAFALMISFFFYSSWAVLANAEKSANTSR